MKSLVKIQLVALAALTIAASTVFGVVVTVNPSQVPRGAYVNGAGGADQQWIQVVKLTFDAGTGPWLTGEEVTISLPAGVTIALVNGGATVHENYVYLIWDDAAGAIADITVAAATDASNIVLTLTLGGDIVAADEIFVIFPVETDSTADATSVDYSVAYPAGRETADGPVTASITFKDEITISTAEANNFSFAVDYTGDDDVSGTKGDVYPAAAQDFYNTIGDWIVDDKGAGPDFKDAASPWAGLALSGANNNAIPDEPSFEIWASQTPGLLKVTAQTAHKPTIAAGTVIAVTPLSEAAAALNDQLDGVDLEEGYWFFYMTSSATADWVIAASDSVEIRHWPTFLAGDTDEGGGYDYSGDGAYTTNGGGAGDDLSVTLESGGTLGKLFASTLDAATNLSALEFFWDLEDVDDTATVDIFLSTDDGLVLADLVLSGSSPTLTIDSVGSNSRKINTSTLYEEGPVGSFTYDIYTDADTYEPAANYYAYIVANDGKNQAVYQLQLDAAAGDKIIRVLHYPYFAFDDIYGPADNFTIDSGTDDYYVISWGVDIDNDKDADDNAVITFYYTPTANDLETIITASGLNSVLNGALLLDAAWTGNVTLIGSTTEDADDKWDNRYMWNWTAESTALTGAGYEVIAHIQGGSDHLFVQYSSDLVPTQWTGAGVPKQDYTFAPAHTAYFRALTPLAGETIELTGDDEIPFTWTAFDLNDADVTNYTSIVMVPLGATMVADYDAIEALAGGAGGDNWYWITSAGDGSLPVGDQAGPLAGSGTFTLDVSLLIDNIGSLGAARPQGFYEVYYTIAWDNQLNAEVPVKAPGVLKFTGSDPDVTSFSLSPNGATLEKGDTLTVSVIARSNGALLVEILNLAIDVPSTYFSVVDQGTDEPFITEATNYNGNVSKNKITSGGGNWQLDYSEVGQSAGDDLNGAGLTVAQFQLVATSSGSGTELLDNIISFVNTDTRATNIVDANANTEASTYPSEAGNYVIAPRGGLIGQIELEATTDAGKTVDVFVLPLGSFTALTDADFLAANGGANADGSVSVVLGTDGAYTVSSMPTGDYDILVHNEYRLDQLSENVAVRPVNSTTQNFTAGDMLLAGDIAGYDDDGIGSTQTLPDNQVNSDDVTAVTNAYGSTSSDTNWYAPADIDGSGLVYIADYNLVNANSVTNGEGLVYKRTAPAPNTGVIARLIALEEQGDVTTYAVALENLGNLHAYSVEMDMDKAQWELLSFSDALSGYHVARKLQVDKGNRTFFASAMVGRNGNVTDSELNLLTIRVRARVHNPEALSIGTVTLVGVDYAVTEAVVEVQKAIPAEFSLSQNYPNPFNPVTTIDFNLPQDGLVKISVFNLLGQEVRTLVSSRLEAGTYKTTWNSQDNFGRRVSTGMYFYRLQVDNKIVSMKKMVLLK